MKKTKKPLSPRFLTTLSIFSLIGQVAWVVENMYFNVFIYKMFGASAADISAMVAASAVAATLTTVLMGALSDKLGRRKHFIAFGYLLWGISIFSFVFLRLDLLSAILPMGLSAAATGVSLAIALDCLMTFFGSTANDAAFNAWLTDSTDESNRGAAEGINAMMPLVAILVVFGGFMFFDLSLPSSWTVIFAVIGVLVSAIGILGLFLIEEPPLKPSKEPYLRGIIHGFLPTTVKKHPHLYVALAAFVIFNISIQIFMPYLILYYEVSLGMTDYVLVMAPAIILASVATVFFGRLYDKKGFTFSVLLSLAALLVGYAILYFTVSTLPVFIGSLLMMCGYLCGMAVFGALIRDNTPLNMAGRFQGVRIFSQVLLPGVIDPAIGKAILADADTIVNGDGTTSFIPSADIFLFAAIAAACVFPVLLLIARTKRPRTVALTTPFEGEAAIPFAEYPRPQMKRDSYLSLNGTWTLQIETPKKTVYDGTITVPFPPESRISGVGRTVGKRDRLIYTKVFTLPEGFCRGRVLLHLGAVDQYAEVFLNGASVGKHTGGYLPFSIDITAALTTGENTLTVHARDPLSSELPYGKQRRKRGGMWYTPTSGIWQSVWLESVPENAIEALKITPTLNSVTVSVTGGLPEKLLTLSLPEGNRTVPFTGDTVTVQLENPILWTPEAPHLYEFTLSSGEDTVSSYFALRTVSVTEQNGGKYLALNGKPYFFHGLLDQGYFSDGIYLPASPRGFENDILRMKECGFNMLRKHIKLEPDLFYYYCDKHGMAVFQDMVNSGPYSFLIDTVLPTVGLRRGITHRASKTRRSEFYLTAVGTMSVLYNHPSVLYYTVFNEGWGQFDADRVYTDLKSFDETRIFDATSGWFKESLSDVESEHIYFKPVKLPKNNLRPVVLSEFGGYSCKMEEHSYNLDNTYGYRFFSEREAFENELIALYDREILPAAKAGLSAAVLTQVSDVEDETNGLLTYDRQVLKVDASRMQALSLRLRNAFEDGLNGCGKD